MEKKELKQCWLLLSTCFSSFLEEQMQSSASRLSPKKKRRRLIGHTKIYQANHHDEENIFSLSSSYRQEKWKRHSLIKKRDQGRRHRWRWGDKKSLSKDLFILKLIDSSEKKKTTSSFHCNSFCFTFHLEFDRESLRSSSSPPDRGNRRALHLTTRREMTREVSFFVLCSDIFLHVTKRSFIEKIANRTARRRRVWSARSVVWSLSNCHRSVWRRNASPRTAHGEREISVRWFEVVRRSIVACKLRSSAPRTKGETDNGKTSSFDWHDQRWVNFRLRSRDSSKSTKW